MLYDIAAAQYLYGANTTYHNTGTKYSADADSSTNVHISGDAKMWTVWDGGGTDTFDFSKVAAASSGCIIDLRGGVDTSGHVNFSHVGQEYIAIASDPATKWTSSIIIENAIGGSGNDTIYGNTGNNSLLGGAGNDLIVAGKGQDTVNGQDGNDTLSDSWWGGLDFTGFSNSNDTLLGGNGNDSLTSYDGTDSLNGGAGNDTVWAMQNTVGATIVTGVAYPSGGGAAEHDNVFSYGQGTKVTGNSSFDRITVFEKSTTLTLPTDTMHSSYDPAHDDTHGDASWSYRGVVMVNPDAFVDISGGGHNSRLVIGNELLEGVAKNDHIMEYTFFDGYLLNIETNQLYSFAEGAALGNPENNLGAGYKAVLQEGSAGWKTLYNDQDEFTPGSVTIDIFNGTHKVATLHNWHQGDFGLQLDDGVRLQGLYTTWPDLLGAAPTPFTAATYAQALAEATAAPAPPAVMVNGTAANDTITGSSSNELISGLGGNDSMSGAAGNDTLDGGTGRDTLTGGAGNNIFHFGSTADSQRFGTGADLITDFTPGQDKIDLSALTFTAFHNGGGNTVEGELRLFYTASADETTAYSDQNGFAFRLSGDAVSTLHDNDIIW